MQCGMEKSKRLSRSGVLNMLPGAEVDGHRKPHGFGHGVDDIHVEPVWLALGDFELIGRMVVVAADTQERL